VKKVVFGLKVILTMCLATVISVALLGCGSSIPSSSDSTANNVATTTATTMVATTNIGNSSVSAMPSVSTVQAGGSFDVSIVVNTSSPTRGLQFVLTWDATKVQCNSVTQGNYFTDFATANNGSMFYLPSNPSPDNSAGRFPQNTNTNPNTSPTYENVLLTGAQGPNGTYLGVTGSGNVYVLNMSALAGASGTVTFSLSDVILGDNSVNTQNMHATVNNGTTTISP
jgi:hypothetical protein